MADNKHDNYEILNLIGYGMAKFGMEFVREFGLQTKTTFYEYIIRCGVAETVGTVKNRQDLFDPFFDNARKGWWQKGNAYIHRKKFIDSLFGEYDVKNYAEIVKLYLRNSFQVDELKPAEVSPIVKSKFKQLQMTGQEAELYFLENYQDIDSFKEGFLEDARLLGDGYDFQIKIKTHFFLVEVKGIRKPAGAFRMTEKEFKQAAEYQNEYGLVIISNLENVPKMTTIFNPIENLVLEKKSANTLQISYHSRSLNW